MEHPAAFRYDPAAANIELEQLPTVRTCRLHPPACAAVLAASSTHACAEAWEMLRGGASASAVRAPCAMDPLLATRSINCSAVE